jgi:hypothetical protein
MMAALGVELIGHVVGQLSASAPTSLTGRRQASMQQRRANAYIVKSSFDQSNLLEVIRRLI